MGRLTRFVATDRADLRDGRQQIIGQRLDYDRDRGLINVIGSRSVPATVIREDPDGGRPIVVQGRQFTCFLKDGKIIAVEARQVAGGS